MATMTGNSLILFYHNFSFTCMTDRDVILVSTPRFWGKCNPINEFVVLYYSGLLNFSQKSKVMYRDFELMCRQVCRSIWYNKYYPNFQPSTTNPRKAVSVQSISTQIRSHPEFNQLILVYTLLYKILFHSILKCINRLLEGIKWSWQSHLNIMKMLFNVKALQNLENITHSTENTSWEV